MASNERLVGEPGESEGAPIDGAAGATVEAARGPLAQAGALALIWLLPLYPLVPRFTLWGPLGIDDIIPFLTVGLACLGLATEPERLRLARGHRKVLAALAVVAVVTSAAAWVRADGASEHVIAVLRTSGRLIFYAAVIVCASSLLSSRERQRLLVMMAVVAFGEASYGVLAYVAKIHGPFQTGMLAYPPDQMPVGGRVRVQGTFGGELPPGETFLNRANFYSAYLAVGLVGLAAFVMERRRRRWAAVAAAVVIGGILVSYSRMSLVAAFAGFLLLAGLYRRWHALLPAVGLVFVLLAVAPGLRERFSNFGTDRLAQWTIATRVIAHYPLWGAGDGHYLDAAIALAGDVDVPTVHTPHNSVLYAAASYGVPAGVALLFLYGTLLVLSVRRWQQRPSLAAGVSLALVVAFLTHDITNNLFFIPEVALAFWVFYAALGERTA